MSIILGRDRLEDKLTKLDAWRLVNAYFGLLGTESEVFFSKKNRKI